ncbi:MAG: glycosyltransferase, partial [Chloroflexi bacterium]|nr:glycosyltransferase [Chloroflexota bacterium]
MLDLSIIIVAYQGEDLLQATLESLVRHTHGVSYELIVVDNSPSPGVQLH